MQNYRFTIITFLLSIICFGPFILKLKDERLEVYPSVVLPSGGGYLSVENELITLFSTDIYGLKDCILHPISKKRFLGEIPIQNYYSLVQGKFGLIKYRDEFKLYKPPIKFSVKNTYTNESIKETKEWLRERMNTLQFQDSIFILRTYKIKIDIATKEIRSKELMQEEIHELY